MKRVIFITALIASISATAITGYNLIGKRDAYIEKYEELDELKASAAEKKSQLSDSVKEKISNDKSVIIDSNDKYVVSKAILEYEGISLDSINVYRDNGSGLAKVATLSSLDDTANLGNDYDQVLEYAVSTTDEQGYCEYLATISADYTEISVAKFADKVICRAKFGGIS